jgi:alkanesulfonate monooxygenase SsuD/methylene tetrahydromethanopterin reductase-like flavin-dependent oxidoreductase (luciferase family)
LARRWRCQPSTTPSRWRRQSPRWITCPAAGWTSASASAGIPTS